MFFFLKKNPSFCHEMKCFGYPNTGKVHPKWCMLFKEKICFEHKQNT